MRKVNKHKFLLLGILSIGVTTSCTLTKVAVKKTPRASLVEGYDEKEVINGFPKHAQPWIVYSDKNKNVVYPTRKFEAGAKYSSFGDPFLVIKKEGRMLKVAKYEPETIVENKIDRKLLKGYGWMHEDDVLLWNGALRNYNNGFYIKAMLAINNKDVILNSAKYIENDSVLLYKDPSLLNLAKSKLALNKLVYIYKFTANKKKALIGEQAFIEADQEQSRALGWVDVKVLSIWGDRTALKIANTTADNKIQVGVLKDDREGKKFKPILNPNEINNRNLVSNLFPAVLSDTLSLVPVKFTTNVLDYSANKIYNVLGKPIYYDRYREILKSNRKINIAFVMDGSHENKNQLSLIKSVLQDLEKRFEIDEYYNQVTYLGQFYNTRVCSSSAQPSINEKYMQLAQFIEDGIEGKCTSQLSQPINLTAAIQKVSAVLLDKKDQVNLVVVIGNTLSSEEYVQSVIRNLTAINARNLFYQVRANRSNPYNDFVLFGQAVVQKTAADLAAYKKTKLLSQDDVLPENKFDIETADEGVYRLDFPRKSMVQGVVAFPKKAEEMRSIVLKQQLENLISDISNDNQRIDSVLSSYFKSSIGISNTTVKADFQKQFGIEGKYVPNALAIQLFDQDDAFLIDGFMSVAKDSLSQAAIHKGILLDSYELEQLQNFYINVYQEVFRNHSINNRRMVRRYMKVIKQRNPLVERLSRRVIRTNTMRQNVLLTTGFDVNTDAFSNFSLNTWKKDKVFNFYKVRDYFTNYKELANKLTEDKGSNRIRIDHQDTYYYWLDTDYAPKFDSSEDQKQKEEAFIIEL